MVQVRMGQERQDIGYRKILCALQEAGRACLGCSRRSGEENSCESLSETLSRFSRGLQTHSPRGNSKACEKQSRGKRKRIRRTNGSTCIADVDGGQLHS